MDEVAKAVLQWARTKYRWPLLFLAAIPFIIFPFIQQYFSLSFRDTLSHPAFWTASGVLSIISGVLYWAILPQGHRLLVGGPLAFTGAVFVYWGILLNLKLPLVGVPLALAAIALSILVIGALLQLRPPSLPEDRLVVAIARFTPVSHGAAEEASNFSHRIEQALKDKVATGAPLEVKRLSTRVAGEDEPARREAARVLGTSREGAAHVVLWGEIRKDEGELYVEPRLTVASPLRKARIRETPMGSFTSYKPDHIEFKKRLAKEIADIATLLYGLAYYEVRRWDQAIGVLEHVQTREGYLYKGLSLWERAQQGLNPQVDLRSAIQSYESVTGAPVVELAQADSLTWAAYLNRANAISLLALSSPGEQSVAHLREAVAAYRAALEVRTRRELPQNWAATQNNLGNALRDLGIRAGGEEGNRLLGEAVAAYRAALEVYTRRELPQNWATTQNNLGAALGDLGIRAGGEEGNRLLGEAVAAYRAALEVRTRRELPQNWATTQNNLANALGVLGIRAGGEEGNRLLGEAVAAYRAALEVYTRRELPQGWATTQNNLGNALGNLGIRAGGEEGMRYLDEAIASLENALSIYDATSFPDRHREIVAGKADFIRLRESLRRSSP